MTRPHRLRWPSPLVLGFALVLIAVAAASDAAAATPFNPSTSACLEDFTTAAECDGSAAPGASADIRTKFALCPGTPIESCTDSYVDTTVEFLPASFSVAKGSDIADGSIVGETRATFTFGLLNNPCFSSVPVQFTLLDGSVDTAKTIDPKPPGQANVMEPLAQDANPPNSLPDGVDSYPSFLNTLFDPDYSGPGPDLLPRTADDVNGPLAPPAPRARLFGTSFVQGQWIVLNVVLFEPGTKATRDAEFDPSLGYPSVVVLLDPTTPASPGAISESCAPLELTTVTFGLTRDNPCTFAPAPGDTGCPASPKFPCANNVDDDADGKVNDGCPQEGSTAETGAQCDNNGSDDQEDTRANDGCPQVGPASEGGLIADPEGCDTDDSEASCQYRGNPQAGGTFNIVTFTVGGRDADDDGIENGLDVCSLKPNADWKPRAADPAKDSDLDGLPVECDPDPSTPSNVTGQSCPAGNIGPDEDQDCYPNRADNCPLHKQTVPADSDGDGIGDACDTTDAGVGGLFGASAKGTSTTGDSRDGPAAALCVVATVTAGSGGAPGSIQVPPCAGSITTDVPDGGGLPPPSDGVLSPTLMLLIGAALLAVGIGSLTLPPFGLILSSGRGRAAARAPQGRTLESPPLPRHQRQSHATEKHLPLASGLPLLAVAAMVALLLISLRSGRRSE